MSYYILPKTNNNIDVNINYSNSFLHNVYISHSLFNYCNKINSQIEQLSKNEDDRQLMQKLIETVNNYECVYSKVPGSKFSVSKLKPKTNLFYEFLEIMYTLNIFDDYKIRNINTLNVSPNFEDVQECIEMTREQFIEDSITTFTETSICLHYFISKNEKSEKINKYDFIFYDALDVKYTKYVIKLTQLLFIILNCQNSGGTSIIKINNLFCKQIVDVLYFLSSIYEKIYIIKPNVSNILNDDKYIVCKGFILNNNSDKNYETIRCNLITHFNDYVKNKNFNEKTIVSSFIDYDVPCYFINKIDDINVILGQQKLETYDQVFNLFKNKNCEDKLELIKKLNIQKSIAWCEKYKIPCNKFSDKTNIFLPIKEPNTEVQTNYESLHLNNNLP